MPFLPSAATHESISTTSPLQANFSHANILKNRCNQTDIISGGGNQAIGNLNIKTPFEHERLNYVWSLMDPNN
jgi:hypothetical protein